MEPPAVPQRPVRAAGTSTSSSSTNTMAAPTVPPRPNRQSLDVSVSPTIPSVRSPLNASPFAAPDSISQAESGNALEKVPTVSAMPLVGQEGMEYASLEQESNDVQNPSGEQPGEPEQTRLVSGDLPMHAPKASVASSTIRSKVEPMTRMDSTGAASAGLAKPGSEVEDHDLPSRVREYRPPSASSRDLARSTSRPQSSRPESLYGEEHEHGIPAIGVQVPMYPNAGDVQAPSPSNFQGPPSTGVGFFNSGGHQRRKSAQFQGPPGSYGLHGHGVPHKDQFEKAWYQKHPEAIEKEEGAYGPGMHNPRSQWAMTSEDLNRIVHSSTNKGNESPGIPSEDVGYELAESSSRFNSPQLRAVKSRTGSSTFAESPLRRAVTASEVADAHTFDSENEDDYVHLGPPRNKSSTPYLASDEVSKHPSSEWLHPAVTSADEQADADDYFPTLTQSTSHGQSKGRNGSRPGSAKFYHDHEAPGTHLDEIEEYEPLFENSSKEKKDKDSQSPVYRLKRPDLDRRRFPSKDVWEDTPTSAQLVTEIENDREPQESLEPPVSSSSANVETSQRELERTTTAGSMYDAPPSFLADEEKKHARREKPSYHPRLQRNFPSRDIWEDTPDSLRLQTFIDESQSQSQSQSQDLTSPTAANKEARSMSGTQEKPPVPARPVGAKPAEAASAQPYVPPRPPQRLKKVPPAETSPIERQPPSLPERPKPQVPPRPQKSNAEETADGETLTKTTSAGSTAGAEATSPTDRSISSVTSPPKAKPAVPAKPQTGSSKFSSVSAGFMNDLNSRLQMGPQAKKSAQSQAPEEAEEEVEEKAPLSDARKIRARGPMRRKPADPSPSKDSAASSASAGWSIVQPWNVWSIANGGADDLVMGKPSVSFTPAEATKSTEESTKDPAVASETPEAVAPGEPSIEEPVTTSTDSTNDATQNNNITNDTQAESEVSTKDVSMEPNLEETGKQKIIVDNSAKPEEVPMVKVEDTAGDS